jgi:DinB family protein
VRDPARRRLAQRSRTATRDPIAACHILARVDRCEECGFDYSGVAAATVPGRLRSFGSRYVAALGRAPHPRRRPADGVWSPLEYTCHVRDVFGVQRQRLALALREERPVFVPMERDERAIRDAYNEQNPGTVLADLAAAADTLADAVDALSEADLARVGIYPWPQPQVRSLLWLARHSVHEGEHHLLDVVRGAGSALPAVD